MSFCLEIGTNRRSDVFVVEEVNVSMSLSAKEFDRYFVKCSIVEQRRRERKREREGDGENERRRDDEQFSHFTFGDHPVKLNFRGDERLWSRST